MESFLSVFEHFMGKYKVLLEHGGADEGSPSHQELCELVASRVSHLCLLYSSYSILSYLDCKFLTDVPMAIRTHLEHYKGSNNTQ